MLPVKHGPVDQQSGRSDNVAFMANFEFVRPRFSILLHSFSLWASGRHTFSSTPSVPEDRKGAISLSLEPVLASSYRVRLFVCLANFGFDRPRFSLLRSSYLTCAPVRPEATHVRNSLKAQRHHSSFNWTSTSKNKSSSSSSSSAYSTRSFVLIFNLWFFSSWELKAATLLAGFLICIFVLSLYTFI
jgi:hypothetical protein